MTDRSAAGPGPRVLVAFGSRHGGTREIAATLARGLATAAAVRDSGLSVVLAPVETRPDPAGFDVVVLGSPVYGGQWLVPVVDYAYEFSPALRERTTWLFSSGLGAGPAVLPAAADAPRWIGACIGARGHRTFPGRVERRLLSVDERRAWSAGRAPAGDFRDRAAVAAWAERIAGELGTRQSVLVA